MKMQLHLSQEEIEKILNSLAQHPYIQVHELIEKIRTQAEGQLQSSAQPQNRFEAEPALQQQQA